MRQIPDPFLVGNLPAKKFEGILKGNFSKFPLSRRRLFYAFPHPRLSAGEAGTQIHMLSKSNVGVVTEQRVGGYFRSRPRLNHVTSALCPADAPHWQFYAHPRTKSARTVTAAKPQIIRPS